MRHTVENLWNWSGKPAREFTIFTVRIIDRREFCVKMLHAFAAAELTFSDFALWKWCPFRMLDHTLPKSE